MAGTCKYVFRNKPFELLNRRILFSRHLANCNMERVTSIILCDCDCGVFMLGRENVNFCVWIFILLNDVLLSLCNQKLFLSRSCGIWYFTLNGFNFGLGFLGYSHPNKGIFDALQLIYLFFLFIALRTSEVLYIQSY